MKMQKVENLIQEINDLIDTKFDNIQTWASLKKWKCGESRKINKSVNTKIIDTENHVRFVTQIPPQQSFDQHWHDCDEMCTVLSGQLKDEVTGRVWNTDGKAIFSRGQKHIPLNPSSVHDLFLVVDFYR